MIASLLGPSLANFCALQGPELQPLHDRQRLVAVLLATGLLVLVLELLRRRKLREEYCWVWIGTSVLLIALAVNDQLLVAMSSWVGAASPISTLFFGAFLFLLALVLQFSVRLSRLTHRHRTLGQRMALLEEEVLRLRERAGTDTAVENPRRRSSDGDRDEVA